MDAVKTGRVLRNLRQKEGKTLAEVAADIGVSISALTSYELGSRTPRDEIKEKLAHYYRQSIAFLFYQ